MPVNSELKATKIIGQQIKKIKWVKNRLKKRKVDCEFMRHQFLK